MRTEFAPSYPVSIFIAGNSLEAENICRDFCDEVGLCVTISHTVYAFTGGRESGVVVGLINYPRFPTPGPKIESLAVELGMKLREELRQESFSVQTPTTTTWFSWRAEDAAQGIETAKPPRRAAGLARQGESPVREANAPKGGSNDHRD